MDLEWDQENDPGCPDCPHSILMHPMKGNHSAGEPGVCAGAGGIASCPCKNRRVP